MDEPYDMTRSYEIEQKLASIFSLATPIQDQTSFYGRREEISHLHEALNEMGMHITLYGERGVGKTSLVNVAIKKNPNFHSVYITCSEIVGMTNLWRAIVQELMTFADPTLSKHLTFRDNGKQGEAKQTNYSKPFLSDCEAFLKTTERDSMGLESLVTLLGRIANPLAIILDEFDLAVKREGMAILFSELVKTFSDRLPQITLIFVGIGNSGSDLIGEHPSLERCLSQVMLRRMQEDEMKELLTGCLALIPLTIHPDVEALLLSLSSGFPYYVHMLGKYAARSALFHRYTVITKINLKESAQKAIKHTFESIVHNYTLAIRPQASFPPQAKYLYRELLLAAAQFKKEEAFINEFPDEVTIDSENFALTDLLPIIPIKEAAFGPQSRQYRLKLGRALSQLTKPSRGAVFEKCPRESRTALIYYHFRNPLLKAYILLKLYLTY